MKLKPVIQPPGQSRVKRPSLSVAAFFSRLGAQGANKEDLARKVMEDPGLVAAVLEGLESPKASVKFGCAKVLRIISAQQPILLYPDFDVFARYLDHENKILQWEAIIVLAELVAVDVKNKFEPIFDRYFRPIRGPVMITAANVIGGAAKIARARPEWADRIAAEILKVRRARYQTLECRNVAIGNAIRSFGDFFDLVQKPEPIARFVRAQLRNPRKATREKSMQFLQQKVS